jgi:basic amino acid/polyamine antiporter, APA family
MPFPASTDTGLVKTLRPIDAVMIVVGNVVGVGIFTTTGFIAAELPDARLIMGAWLLGGILTILGALAYGELGAAFPRAGGDYVYLREAYGPLAGFLVGWVGFFIINPGSIAALGLGLSEYLLPLVVRDPAAIGTGMKNGVALGAIICFSLVNYISLRWSSRAQNLVSGLNLLTMVLILAVGFLWGSGNWGHLSYRAPDAAFGGLFGPAMVSVFFTYSGWFVAAYVASEMKQPQRTLPLAMLSASLIVTVLYLLMNLFYLYALPVPAMAGVVDIARQASEALLGGGASIFFSIMIILGILGSLNSVILTAPRIYFAMARDRLFPRFVGRAHPRFRTPHQAVAVQAVVSAVMVLAGTFYQLLAYTVFFMLFTSLATVAGLFVLRLRRPGLERPFKVWGYPVTPLLFIAAYGWIGVRLFLYNPTNALIGIAIVLSGVPFYFFWQHKA